MRNFPTILGNLCMFVGWNFRSLNILYIVEDPCHILDTSSLSSVLYMFKSLLAEWQRCGSTRVRTAQFCKRGSEGWSIPFWSAQSAGPGLIWEGKSCCACMTEAAAAACGTAWCLYVTTEKDVWAVSIAWYGLQGTYTLETCGHWNPLVTKTKITL